MIKKSFLRIITFLIIYFSACFAFSQEKKVIVLKDGTKIIGEILSLENSIYTVNSSIGQLKIQDRDIVNIAIPEAAETSGPLLHQNVTSAYPIDNQVRQMQQQLMANPAFIAGAKKITEDQDVMKILSQPDIMQAITNQDIKALEENPELKKLLNNPSILELIQAAGQTVEQPHLNP